MSSVYIHLPFCRGRCPYCDFVSSDAAEIPYAAYQEAIAREWRSRSWAVRDQPRCSVYIGGGTPSLWPAERLGRLLKTALPRTGAGFGTEGPEISVEVNPQDQGEPWFGRLAETGVNRVSIGVQALDNDRLRWLGRRHDRRQAEDAVRAAVRTGFGSVGADLIYGTPGQSITALVSEIRALAGLGVQHVSAYELTAHRETRLGRQVDEGRVALPDSDEMADLWQAVSATLAQEGFERYEISNFARAGHRCRHNENYWRGGVYIGLGAGAWGFTIGPGGEMHRYSNSADVEQYMKAVEQQTAHPLHTGLGPGAYTERISEKTRAQELMMLGLRTSRGVSLEEVYATLPAEEARSWVGLVDELVKDGTATLVHGRLALGEKSLLLADGVAQRFF